VTPGQRKQEFDRLFDGMAGKRVERIRAVMAALYCREGTVRQWLMKTPPRIIPEAKLAILKRELSRQ